MISRREMFVGGVAAALTLSQRKKVIAQVSDTSESIFQKGMTDLIEGQNKLIAIFKKNISEIEVQIKEVEASGSPLKAKRLERLEAEKKKYQDDIAKSLEFIEELKRNKAKK